MSFTIGKNVVAYIISTKVAYSFENWITIKLGAKIGLFAGPVGAFIGAISGATIGWLIDAFGDEVIKWIVSWFD